MQTHQSGLCVGGPLSGRRYQASSKTGFVVPVASATQDDPVSTNFQSAEKIDIELMRYRAELFHTPQGAVAFWVPEGQAPLETIKLLLESYEQTRALAAAAKTAIKEMCRTIAPRNSFTDAVDTLDAAVSNAEGAGSGTDRAHEFRK